VVWGNNPHHLVAGIKAFLRPTHKKTVGGGMVDVIKKKITAIVFSAVAFCIWCFHTIFTAEKTMACYQSAQHTMCTTINTHSHECVLIIPWVVCCHTQTSVVLSPNATPPIPHLLLITPLPLHPTHHIHCSMTHHPPHSTVLCCTIHTPTSTTPTSTTHHIHYTYTLTINIFL